MYSTFATSTGADALEENTFLFHQASDGLISMPMPHGSAHIKAPGSHILPIGGLNKLMYGQYNESTPSSTHFGDTHDVSERSGSHMSGREDRDGSISSGYVNGQEGSHAPSPLHYPHSLHSSSRPEASTNPANLHAFASNGDQPSFRPTKQTISPPTTILPPYSDKNTSAIQDSTVRSKQELDHASEASSTPELFGSQGPSNTHHSRDTSVSMGKVAGLRANSSIPAAMSWGEFARQSILAAESSRLNPFALHPQEYKLLRNHITHAQVTIYLNIRNAILRIWTKNPMVNVTVEEAAGCARDKRYFNLAIIAHSWLLRSGYINFGCVEVTNTASQPPRSKAKASSPRTILVIGAGMSGLGCARHLEGLFSQLGDQWTDEGEEPPKVIVLEARPRIGGRVYSHPLRNQANSSLPPGHRCTAEMGAQIVTGFEHGNPMNALIRGQLGIPYHGLRDNTILYDHDGSVVEKSQDTLVERLYNDVLERAAVYRQKPAAFRTVEGDRNMMAFGREPSDIGGPTIAMLEDSNAPLPASSTITALTTEEKPSTGVEKLAGRAYQLSGFDPSISAATAVQNMGWALKAEASVTHSLDLDPTTRSSEYPTLGETMDEGIMQYQNLVDLKPKDLRLFNWHHANLEYANAVSVNKLSLSGWDQDIGNEFEGQHTQIIGGYQQVPRGLWLLPTKLDVRFKAVVKSIQYNAAEERGAGKAVRVECHNGDIYEADEVVLTSPLGVLKSGSIHFQPPLPEWKQEVIERMGFGLLNKVVLVYEEAFWEPHRDMFGLLNEAERQASLNAKDYASQRGRYYLFWNCIKTSGRPTLIALMAGDAAHYAESTSNEQLIKEVTERLTKMFAPKTVPLPSETIVTRWSKDPFARGSYSYVGAKTLAGDYDVMARPHGPLHFAGEATCGTHPATVHGAYLSGLRAAAEVVESMIGPIKVPSPLVEKKIKLEHPPTPVSLEPKQPEAPPQSSRSRPKQLDEDYEASIIGAILSEIGERPIKPGRSGVNPFLLYTKDYWYICKKKCDEARQESSKDPNAKAPKGEIRSALGLMWRTASEEIKKPYLDQTQAAKDAATADIATYKERVTTWDTEAARIRNEYIQNNPPPSGDGESYGRTAIELGGTKRVRRI